MLSSEIYEIFKNTYFEEHLGTTASGHQPTSGNYSVLYQFRSAE